MMWQNSKTQYEKKYEKNQKIKMWQKSKTQNLTKLENSKRDKTQNTNCDKTRKLKMWQNSKLKIVKTQKNQLVTNLINWNCDQSPIQKILNFKTLISLLVRITWQLNNQWDVLCAAFCVLKSNH